MPALIQELHNSRTFDVNVTGGTAQYRYVVTGESDEATVYDLVLATSPGVWYGYTRDRIDMSQRDGLTVWFPVVNYSIPVYNLTDPVPTGVAGPTGQPGTDTPPASSPSSAPPPSGQILTGVSVNIALENQHVELALEVVDSDAIEGSVAPDTKLIGVSADKIDGVDIGVPVANIVYQKTVPASAFTAGYFKNLLSLCGTTNEEEWWMFGPEEALLTGCNGQSKGTGEFEVSYEFKYQRTKRDIVIREGTGEELTGGLICPEKRGWHYLWTTNKKREQGVPGSTAIVYEPVSYHVCRVYERSNFNWLGI